MANIFELLNSAQALPAEDADVILTREEQDKLFQMILRKDKKEKRVKKGFKRTIAAAAVLAIIISCTIFRADIQAMAEHLVSYFTGNSKSDYAKPVHESVDQDNGTMELLSVSREDGKIYMKVKFNFTEDITELTSLCGRYKMPGYNLTDDGKIVMDDGTVVEENCTVMDDFVLSEDGSTQYDLEMFYEDVYSDYNEPERYVLYAPPFINSTILINDADYAAFEETMENVPGFPVYLLSVRNVDISGTTLIQDVVLYLNDWDYQEDINITFRYKDIELTNHTVKGEWNLDYTISGTEYETVELNKMPINLSTISGDGVSYTLEAYSVTPAGIKLYGKTDWNEKVMDNPMIGTVRITAYDDLGNKYLMYDIQGDTEEDVFYPIYDGPADANDEYLDRLDSNAKTFTVAFEELTSVYDENGQFIGEESAIISDELTLPIEPEK